MRCVGLISFVVYMATCVVAQPQLKLEGTLKGYFLAPDGVLAVCEVPFSFPNEPILRDLPNRLFVLWAGYYLQAKFASEKPIQSVWLLASNGRLLWRRHYPAGVTEGTIPYQGGGWVGVKGQDGVTVRLIVRFVDGKEMFVQPYFPVRFERVLPLKVDWLDFIRIAEVANLLKVKGKEIWEGFSLDGIPFLLEGDEGQWVLINHPKPPKGFVRYKGPLPKVPFGMTVHVGETKGGERKCEEFGGWLEKINGVWTAALRYFPNWWVLDDCAPPGYTVNREPDAIYRLETIIHEAFHVWWFQRVKEPKMVERIKKAQAIVTEVAERECLARALEAKGEKERQRWTKAFIMQRQKRRQQEGVNEAEVTFERWQETMEGVATFVGWKAIKLGQEKDYQPIPEMNADAAFYGYHQKSLDEETIAKAVRQGGGEIGHPHALGLAQTLLLSGVKGWKSEVLKGKSLEELLSHKVQGVILLSDFLAELKQSAEEEFKQALEKIRGNLIEVKPPEPNVTIWLTLPVEIVRMVNQMKEAFGNPLFGLSFFLSEINFRIAPPVWVSPDEPKKRVGILWDANKQLMVLHRPDGTVTLQGDGLEIQGNLQVTWDINGVHVHPDEKTQKAIKGGASTIMRRKAWYAVVLPVALLTAIASHDTKALQEQETITMEGVITGVFINAVTNQFETVTLTVPSVEEDYYFADEEEYVLTATFVSSRSPSNPTTQDFIISVSATIYFDGGGIVWNFGIAPSEITIGGKPYKIRVVEDDQGNVWIEVINEKEQIVARFPIRKVPPPGQLLVKVFLMDIISLETGEWTIKPLPNVRVEAYIKEKCKAKVYTDPNGEALFPALAPEDYQLRGYAPPENTQICPKVTQEATVVKGQRDITSMYFYLHKGIKGKVRVETPWMPEMISEVGIVCLAREAKANEVADFTITNPDGSTTRYKKIVEARANREIRKGNNWVEGEFHLPYPQPEKPDGQAYELFAFISGEFPIPSNYHWEPKFGWRYVFVPPCKRGEGGECQQCKITDVGLVVTFHPVEGGDDGIENPSPKPKP